MPCSAWSHGNECLSVQRAMSKPLGHDHSNQWSLVLGVTLRVRCAGSLLVLNACTFQESDCGMAWRSKKLKKDMAAVIVLLQELMQQAQSMQKSKQGAAKLHKRHEVTAHGTVGGLASRYCLKVSFVICDLVGMRNVTLCSDLMPAISLQLGLSCCGTLATSLLDSNNSLWIDGHSVVLISSKTRLTKGVTLEQYAPKLLGGPQKISSGHMHRAGVHVHLLTYACTGMPVTILDGRPATTWGNI